MENVVLTVHLILALLLVGVVLLQRSEGGGLGMGGGGGGAMSSRGAANALTKLTWVFAVAFLATSLTLYVLAANRSGGLSVVDQPTVDAPATQSVSGLSGTDLTPPPATDEPLTPPPSN